MAETKAPKRETKGAKSETLHPLDLLAQDPITVIALMLWQRRIENPDMSIQIMPKDVNGFHACLEYLEVEPDVMIRRPPGVPAQDAIPAAGKRRAVPARPAIPPRDYLTVTLVEKGTENVIRPVEDNEQDYDRSQDAAKVRHARDSAPRLAARLLEQARTGETSLSDMTDAANALLLLARGPA